MALSRRQTQALWREDARKKQGYFRKYTRVWRKYYDITGDGLTKAVQEANGVNDIDLQAVIRYEDTRALFIEMYEDVGVRFARDSFLTTKQDGNIINEAWANAMNQYVLAQGGESIVSVYETNLTQAQRIIQQITNQAVIEGLGATETAALLEAAIADSWKDYGRWSAERIARTEVIAASNYGSMVGAKSTGLKLRKVWLTALDGRERQSHAEANNQIVGIDTSFTVGGEQLMFPGDKNGSGENVINCRCSVAYRSDLLD